MTPQELKLLQDTSKQVKELSSKLDSFLNIYYRTNFPDKIIFEKDVEINSNFSFNFDVTIADTKNIVLGTTTGTKIGTSTSQKLAFFNKTPITQQASIASPTAPSAAYAQAEAQSMKTAVDAIRNILTAFGFTA